MGIGDRPRCHFTTLYEIILLIASVEDFPGTLTGASRFQYDLNGNLTRDDYRSLSLYYNSFNLPYQLDFGNNKNVSYFYDGSEGKLTKIVSTGTGVPVCT